MEKKNKQVGLLFSNFKMYAQLLNIDVQTQATSLLMLLFDLSKKKLFTPEELQEIIDSIMVCND
jgi:hypothetical protein